MTLLCEYLEYKIKRSLSRSNVGPPTLSIYSVVGQHGSKWTLQILDRLLTAKMMNSSGSSCLEETYHTSGIEETETIYNVCVFGTGKSNAIEEVCQIWPQIATRHGESMLELVPRTMDS